MAFHAEQRKISEILSGDRRYTIPRYQRKYVWVEKQWRELLDDLKYCLENEDLSATDQDWTHFLGSFVFEKIPTSNKLIVIDGQQRLTTIIIMLCAVCVLFNELGEQDRFNGVTKYILGIDDLGKPYTRVGNDDLVNFQLLVDDATVYNSLQSKRDLFSSSYLVSAPKDNLNIKHCFNFYYTQFSEMLDVDKQKAEELSRIKDKILSLDVIEILATNQQESYNIFEILNARGVDLEQHELIKNYVLKYVQPRSDIDRAKIQWDKLENLLFVDKRPVIGNFFTHYVAHRFEKPTKDNSEFRIIKAKADKNKMGELLDDLIQKAQIYVSKTVAIPYDYAGHMGVPITFLQKYNPEQFEILGISRTLADPIPDDVPKRLKGGLRFYIKNADGSYKCLFERLVIRNKEVYHDDDDGSRTV